MQPRDAGTERASESAKALQSALAEAKLRIAALEAQLAEKETAIDRLLADDLETCEELTELQRIIWGYHRGLSGGCDCDICAEVEASQRELEGLF